MGSKHFGHVGDEVAKPTGGPEVIPRFDQSHVDYLKKTYLSDHAFAPATRDDLVKLQSWAAMDVQAREIITHIENLIANQKGAI